MAVAIQGAMLIREYQQAYTDNIVYRRRCDNCGYLAPTPSASLGHHCPSQRESGPQVVLCFGIASSPRLPSWSR